MKSLTIIILAFSLAVLSCKDVSLTGVANDTIYLRQNGVDMPIRVFGNIESDKMILVVHGGPGGNAIVYRDKYVVKNVETEYCMIYWDQRYAGGSQGYGGETNISAFRDDLKKVIQLLKSKYGQNKKIFVFGHSWGGFVAPYFLIDGDNQNLAAGWIQVDGAHDYNLNDSLTHAMLIEVGNQQIALNNNVSSWQPIVDYCNSHTYNENYNVAATLNSYAHQAEGLMSDVQFSGSILPPFNNFTPYTSHSMNGMASGINEIDRPTYNENIGKSLYKVTIPTLLLWGKYDFVCPKGLMTDIVNKIGSTDVTTKIFDYSGHSPMMNEPEAFWTEVMNWISTH